jgi:hypothetical protein
MPQNSFKAEIEAQNSLRKAEIEAYIDALSDEELAELLAPEPVVPEPVVPESVRTRNRKPSPTLVRATRAINELYPDTLPDQATLPTKLLHDQVAQLLEQQRRPKVSETTVRRAAGRRKPNNR